MPENPRIDDRSFFEMLQDASKSQWDSSRGGDFPWQWRVFGEDRFGAEEQVRFYYAKLRLPAPKMSWASSPAALWSAVTMLKQFAMKSDLVDSLVPRQGLVSIEGEAKRSLLSAIINDDLMVGMGAPVAPMLRWKLWNTPPRVHQAIHEADRLITSAARASDALSRSKSPAGWSDAVLYPVLHTEGHGHLAANAFCILPYSKICWLCLPPLFVKTDFNGHLHSTDGPAIKWADGYELHATYRELELAAPEDDTLLLGTPGKENETARLLNGAVDGLVKKGIEGDYEK